MVFTKILRQFIQNNFHWLATLGSNSVIKGKQKRTMRFRYIPILLFSILFSACHQDFEEITDIEQNTDDPQIIITTELNGRLSDLDGNVLNDYTLDFGSSTVDINTSYFLEELNSIQKYGQYLRIQHAGEFRGFANLLLVENDINILDLYTFPKPSNSDIVIGSAFDLSPQSSIELKQLAKNSGDDYNGEIRIETIELNDPKLDRQLGNIGYDSNNQLVSLQIVDRFYFELKDNNANALKIHADRPAIYSNTYGSAELTGLFRFNEDKKRWEWISDYSEGKIRIKETGYYMLADYSSAVYLEGNLLMDGGSPLSYQEYTWNNANLNTRGQTTLSGKFLSAVPASSELEFSIGGHCGIPIESFTYSSLDTDQKEIELNIENDGEHFFNLSTEILSCDEEFSFLNAVQIKSATKDFVYAFEENLIDRWISVCSSSFEVAAYDFETDDYGPRFSWSTQILEPIDYLSKCPEHVNGFAYLTIRQDKKIYSAIRTENLGDKTILESQNGEIKFLIDGNTPGVYTEDQLNIKINDNGFGDHGYAVSCENSTQGCGITNIYVSHYEEMPGGWIRITFSGEVWMQTITPAAAGNFPIGGTILSKVN